MTPLLAFIAGAVLGAPAVSADCTPTEASGRPPAACEMTIAPTRASQTEDDMQQPPADEIQQHPYIGMWVTEDGRIRQELLPNGRYDEARGARQSAYVGRYEVTGTSIFYWDDTGFTADGEFVDANTLRHGGMIFLREE